MRYLTRFSSDTPPTARIGGRTVVVPLPAARQAWLVWDDPSPGDAPEGPHDVVAIAYQQRWLEADAEVAGLEGDAGRHEPFHAARAVEGDAGGELEFDGLRLSFIVLPRRRVNWESLAMDQKYVFFSEEAAKEELAIRAAGGTR